jgi:hypothetical protein
VFAFVPAGLGDSCRHVHILIVEAGLRLQSNHYENPMVFFRVPFLMTLQYSSDGSHICPDDKERGGDLVDIDNRCLMLSYLSTE